MIDSHCHLEFGSFDKDREQVIRRSKERIRAVVVSCVEIKLADRVLNLHERYPHFIFPSMGFHPTEATNTSSVEIEKYKNIILDNYEKVVAIGEVGLDYHHIKKESEKEECKEVFRDFIDFSNELNLPLVVHSRDSMGDTLDILTEKEGEVMIHCFSGSVEDVELVLSRGYYLSFGGAIFRSEDKYRKILRDVPLENLLLETDAPFLAKSKSDRSEPWFIREVAERIAKTKNIKFSDVWRVAEKNAVEFFDLPLELIG